MRTAAPIAFVTAVAVAVATLSGVALAFPLADVEPNWARESIQRLVEAGVAQGYPDGTFRPDQPITRAQFAQMAARAFQLEPGPDFVFADAQDHPARRDLAMLVSYGALAAERDTTIAPEKPLTRAEAARALVALLGLTTLEGRVRRAEGIAFDDVPAGHPFFAPIQLAARLGLFPPFMRGRLWPDEAVSRAEAAFMVDAALRLERHSGQLERIDAERRVLWISGPNRTQRSFPVSELDVLDTERVVPWTALEPGRSLHLIVNRFGRPLLAWTEPEGRYAGLRETLREVAVELLTPEQVRAVLDGDWEHVADGVRVALYKELVARGVRPWEADALLALDWTAVQELGLVRLSEAVGQYLNVSPQLVAALIDRDWVAARNYAQVEALERLLQSQLFQVPDNPGGSSSSRSPGTQQTPEDPGNRGTAGA